MSQLFQSQFKAVFTKEFNNLIQRSVTKEAAAAQALIYAHTVCKKSDNGNHVPLKSGEHLPDPKIINRRDFTAIISNCSREFQFEPLISLVASHFSSHEIVCNSFCPSETRVGEDVEIDVIEIAEMYQLLANLHCERVSGSLFNALVTLTNQMQYNAPLCDSQKSIKHFIFVLEFPELLDPQNDVIVSQLLLGIDKLKNNSKRFLCGWIMRNAGELRYRKYITVLRQHMTFCIYQSSFDDARVATRCLGLLYCVLSAFPGVHISEFYNDALSDDYMASRDGRRHEFSLWIREQRPASTNDYIDTNQSSFISYPFVLSPSAKAMVLEFDAAMQMRRNMDHEIQIAMATGDDKYLCGRLSQ